MHLTRRIPLSLNVCHVLRILHRLWGRPRARVWQVLVNLGMGRVCCARSVWRIHFLARQGRQCVVLVLASVGLSRGL